jgi:hypothetical protein
VREPAPFFQKGITPTRTALVKTSESLDFMQPDDYIKCDLAKVLFFDSDFLFYILVVSH